MQINRVVLCDESDDVEKFNKAMEEQGMNPLQKYIPLDVDKKTFDGVCQGEWFMSDEYKNLNVHNYILTKELTQEETARAAEELAEFEQRGMINRITLYDISCKFYERE